MKKTLSILGGIFLLLIVVGGGFIGYMVYQGRGMDSSSKAYVEANVPPILSTWSEKGLLKRSSPLLLKVLDDHPKQLDLLFHKFSELGHLKSFGDVRGESKIMYNTKYGKVTTAYYQANAKFENGKALITVRLIRSPEGKWQFLLFNVKSPLFLQ